MANNNSLDLYGSLQDGWDYLDNLFTTSIPNYFRNRTNIAGKEIPNSSPFSKSIPGQIINWGVTPRGSGDNAVSPLQIGIGALGLWQKKNQFDDQLDEARRQYEFSKNNTRANFLTQGANYLNQGLWQLEALNAFNPQAASERANNMQASLDTMNKAGAGLGLGNNAFQAQADALSKYNKLQPNMVA